MHEVREVRCRRPSVYLFKVEWLRTKHINHLCYTKRDKLATLLSHPSHNLDLGDCGNDDDRTTLIIRFTRHCD